MIDSIMIIYTSVSDLSDTLLVIRTLCFFYMDVKENVHVAFRVNVEMFLCL